MMLKRIAIVAALPQRPCSVPAAQAQNAVQNGVLVIYGDDKCPTNDNGEEIVVCQRLDEVRALPHPARPARPIESRPQISESWAVRSEDALDTAPDGRPAAVRPWAPAARPDASCARPPARAPRHGRAGKKPRTCRCPERAQALRTSHAGGSRQHALADDPQHRRGAETRGDRDMERGGRRPAMLHPREPPEFGEIGGNVAQHEQRDRP